MLEGKKSICQLLHTNAIFFGLIWNKFSGYLRAIFTKSVHSWLQFFIILHDYNSFIFFSPKFHSKTSEFWCSPFRPFSCHWEITSSTCTPSSDVIFSNKNGWKYFLKSKISWNRSTGSRSGSQFYLLISATLIRLPTGNRVTEAITEQEPEEPRFLQPTDTCSVSEIYFLKWQPHD